MTAIAELNVDGDSAKIFARENEKAGLATTELELKLVFDDDPEGGAPIYIYGVSIEQTGKVKELVKDYFDTEFVTSWLI